MFEEELEVDGWLVQEPRRGWTYSSSRSTRSCSPRSDGDAHLGLPVSTVTWDRVPKVTRR